MAKRIKALRIGAIATVDQGDNPHAKIVFYKRKKDGDMPDKTPTVEELQKQLKDANDKATAAEAKQAELQKQLNAKKDPPKDPDPLEKADPVIKARLAEYEKRAEEAEKREKANADAIAKMKADQRRTTFISKAAEFPSLGKADDVGQILEKIDGVLTDAQRKTFFEKLASIEAVIAKSQLFSELGEDTGHTGSAEQKVEKMARDAVAEKAGKGEQTTYAAEYSRIIKANPKLYEEIMAEQRGGN